MSGSFKPFESGPRRREFVEVSKAMLGRGQELEEVLRMLRQNGCSKPESAGVLALAMGVPLAAAKEIVHGSQTWRDAMATDEALHAELEGYLERIQGPPHPTQGE